jgi:hypothetical protein
MDGPSDVTDLDAITDGVSLQTGCFQRIGKVAALDPSVAPLWSIAPLSAGSLPAGAR